MPAAVFSCDNQKSLDTVQCPLRKKLLPVENHCFKVKRNAEMLDLEVEGALNIWCAKVADLFVTGYVALVRGVLEMCLKYLFVPNI